MKIVRNLSYLNKSQISSYSQNGYLVLPNMISHFEIAKLKRRAFEHIESWKPTSHPIFTTDQASRVFDDYFMKSAYHISFFLEESVKPPVTDKHNSINKIGHALHDLDNLFRKFSYRSEFKKIFQDLGYAKPQIVQSQYILKAPKIGGYVKAHQDNSYIITEPKSCTGIWVALEDAGQNNACLYAVPGSHSIGTRVLWQKMKNGEMKYSNSYEYSMEGGVCLEVKAGTVILLNGDLVHWSDQNLSDKSRHAYTMHVVEGEFKWSEKNWLQRPEYFPFRIWD